MPLVTSSENGFFGQTESPLGIFGEMWCCKIMCGLILSLFNYCWNTLTVEGDSPVDLGYCGRIIFSWVAFIGNWAWIFLGGIDFQFWIFLKTDSVFSTARECWKEPIWLGVKSTWNQIVTAWHGMEGMILFERILVTFSCFFIWLVLCHSSWNTSQGVCSCGEAKRCVAL